MNKKSQEKPVASSTPDELIEQLGGCGRYQVRMAVVIHLIKTIVNFSGVNLVIFSSTPLWYCQRSDPVYENITSCFGGPNNNSLQYCDEMKKTCKVDNSTKCIGYDFDPGFNTFPAEFNLVCGDDFIPSTINSVSVLGILAGSLIGGQLADLIGRKRPFFASLVILLIFHMLGFFATSWEVLVVVSFCTGLANGFFFTIQYTILTEYSLPEWRVWMVGFPTWPMQTCLYALLAWLIHDWRYMQLLTSLLCIPALLTWFTIPESFRWYISHDRNKEAAEMISKVAKFNKVDAADINLDGVVQKPVAKDHNTRKYTFLHLFKTKKLAKVTLLLMLNWAAIDISAFGIGFGIQTLSGNIYFNLFLFSIVGIPSKFIAIKVQNRFGRRFANILCFGVIAISSLTVGVIQTLSPPGKDALTNGFAFLANAGIAGAWGPLQTLTLEVYPTVIRNIGFGVLSVVGKISGVLGPQLVYLNSYAPGLLFYTCGGLSLLSTFGTMLIPETKGLALEDKIITNKTKKDETVRVNPAFVSDEKNIKV